MSDLAKSIRLAELLVGVENRILQLTKPETPPEILEREKRLRDKRQAAVDADPLAQRFLDQARRVVAAEEAREKVIEDSGLADLVALLSNLSTSIERPEESKVIATFEDACKGIEQAFNRDDKHALADELASAISIIMGALKAADIPQLLGYQIYENLGSKRIN
jgi:hypothetical protein